MSEKKEEYIYNLKIDNVIWIMYIILIVLNIISNYFEKLYIIGENKENRNIFRSINIYVFTMALFIYAYFIIKSINNIENINYAKSDDNKIRLTKLSFWGNFIFLIGGIIVLYIEIQGYNEEIELEI